MLEHVGVLLGWVGIFILRLNLAIILVLGSFMRIMMQLKYC
jgi:hypothetical protein